MSALLLASCLLCGCGKTGQKEEIGTESKSDITDSDLEAKTAFSADEYYALLESCKEQIEAITDFKPEVVLVLGTGMGDFVEEMETKEVIPYDEIKGWPQATAPQHKGNLVFSSYNGLKVAIMQGRIHYYEGYSMAEVVIPLRVLHLLGADTVILTNSVGFLNKDFKVGDFVCARDHISSFVESPLIGENIDELGERFPGMTKLYDQELQDIVLEIGKELDIPVHSGIYIQVPGPQFEIPAEINVYRKLGADTVGMSSAVEAIAAGHMGMRICDINCVTNMAAGLEEEGFTQESLQSAAEETKERFATLIKGLLDRLL